MKIVMGNIAQTTPDATTVTIAASVSDPVPTCQFSIIDNNSSLQALAWQEIFIIDEKQIANPTINMLANPSMNPYGTNWATSPTAGLSLSQITGGGVQAAVTNVPGTLITILVQTFASGSFLAGQSYCFSIYFQSVGAVVSLSANLSINWLDAGGNFLSSVNSTAVSISTTLSRMTMTVVAPANASGGTFAFNVNDTDAGTNSGTIKFTQAQVEPVWFASQSYPTPWVGPSQANCRQLPLGQWIRQYRKFGGFVTGAEYGGYIGNKRTIVVSGSGYAIILSTILSNKSYTNQYDSAILTNLFTSYVTSQTTPFVSAINMIDTTNVVQGIQLSNFVLNWDDLRTAANNLASQIGWYWSVGYYWDAIYAPPGYLSHTFSLIADGSSVPDNVTTFPVQHFKATMDATQPGSNILILGNGSNTAQVFDPIQINMIGVRSGYYLPITTSWMRKVNESSLNSTTDCTNRGIAELLQYDYERYIYTLTTDNVELLPGYGVQVTSATDNLNKTTLLIQQVKATWTGKNEFLADVWIYDATLGAINRNVASILSRLFRLSNSNTSAVAIASTTLVAFERLGVTDGPPTTSSAASGYQATILADTPLAYYRLDELLGTIADDFSGNANAGTLHGGVTLNATGLLHSGGDPAMSFNGTSGYISLPTTLIPTGSQHAWSLECWCRVSSLPTNQWNAMVAMGNRNNNNFAGLFMNNTASVYKFDLGLFGADVFSSAQFTANTTYHVVGTFDGTNARLYVNASLAGGPTAATVSLATNFASIGSDGSSPVEFYPGTIDEVAVYNYALSSTQISDHYTVGST